MGEPMEGELYIIACPRCGSVEGFLPAGAEDRERDDMVAEVEDFIEEREFDTDGGPVSRVRCPRCGTWVDADLARPA